MDREELLSSIAAELRKLAEELYAAAVSDGGTDQVPQEREDDGSGSENHESESGQGGRLAPEVASDHVGGDAIRRAIVDAARRTVAKTTLSAAARRSASAARRALMSRQGRRGGRRGKTR